MRARDGSKGGGPARVARGYGTDCGRMGSQSESLAKGNHKVNEQQTFGVLVRAIGVTVVLNGARQLWFEIVRFAYPPSVFRYPVSQDLLYAFTLIALGAIMIRWPDWIVRFAWPQESEPSN